MYTRYIELNINPDTYTEFKKVYENQILPLIKTQTGFLDTLTLKNENYPDKFISLTLWKTKTDAVNYQNNAYSKVLELLSPYLEGIPRVEYFTVEYSTMHKQFTVAA